MATMKITKLYVYPIKSLRGIELSSSDFNAQGLQYDRRFMLLKVLEDGTLKNMHIAGFYEMALFHCSISDGTIHVEYRTPTPPISPATESQNTVLSIPAEPDCAALERLTVNMHGSPTSTAYRMDDEINQWFSNCFGYQVVLAYIGDGRRKALGSVNPNVPEKSSLQARVQSLLSSGEPRTRILVNSSVVTTGILGAFAVWSITSSRLSLQKPQAISSALVTLLTIIYGLYSLAQHRPKPALITFSDCAAFLVVNEASFRNVRSRLMDCNTSPSELISKFRANIVVDGDSEWDEDYWNELTINPPSTSTHSPVVTKAKIKLTANCARCVSLNVDLDTGKQAEGDEGLLLKKLMGDRRIDSGSKYSPVFGRYGFPCAGQGKLSVGDEVQVSRRNREQTTWDWPGLTTS